jgi:hypothetical protein
MIKDIKGRLVTLSRRATLRSLAGIFVVIPQVSECAISSSNARLLALGNALDEITGRLDRAVGGGYDVEDGWLEDLDRIEAEILKTQASTIDGLRVKARAACWALLGDLDSVREETTDQRMAISIIRDLVRGYDPQLERPGAVKQLVEEIEKGADKPSDA